MEAINNLANTASKAIWGESTQEEPVSGVKGDTSKGEPFDAGNKEEQDALSGGRTTESTTATSAGSAAGPTQTKDSSVTTGDSTKAQNDVRDPSNPQTDEDKAERKEDVNNDTSGGLADQDKVKGPGPKPLDEVAKQNGGDAGKAASGENLSGDDKQQQQAGEQKAGGAPQPQQDEDEDGPQKVSHGEGTGEKYVKSSGLQADGGDFDAANPGAGREADRLLEEKGVHVGGDNHVGAGGIDKSDSKDSKESSGQSHGHAAAHRDTSPKETKEKRSLSEKIKAKLHKN